MMQRAIFESNCFAQKLVGSLQVRNKTLIDCEEPQIFDIVNIYYKHFRIMLAVPLEHLSTIPEDYLTFLLLFNVKKLDILRRRVLQMSMY